MLSLSSLLRSCSLWCATTSTASLALSSRARDVYKRQILDNPEMLQLRGILVYPHGDNYIVIGGNMRLRAMIE